MPADGEQNRREFLRQAGAFLLMPQAGSAAKGPALVDHHKGGFRFLRGIAPYSSGAVAMKGFEVVHVTLVPPLPYRQGFAALDRHLSQESRPPQALCGIELRSPRPFSFAGFNAFNREYVAQLEQRGVLFEGLNPVARTNVAPEVGPPGEVSLYGFSYTAPAGATAPTFVIAGAGELVGERLEAGDIVRRGDVSAEGIAEKAASVLERMERRLRGLGVEWGQATVVNVYTVHNVFPLLRKLLLPRLGPAQARGIHWHFARPPIQELEFEMDVRGCRRELVR